MKNKEQLIIFAKEPELGKVKTRLAKAIGDSSALTVYRSLLKKTFGNFEKTSHDVAVYFTPTKKRLKRLAPRKSKFIPQSGKDLGLRLLNAFKKSSKKYEKTIIIGTDCPFVTKEVINKAFKSLGNRDVVVGPTKDGGYYLIGLKKPLPKLFKGIAWSTEKVLKQTLNKCRLLGVKPFLLKKLYDIDTASDLRKWRK